MHFPNLREHMVYNIIHFQMKVVKVMKSHHVGAVFRYLQRETRAFGIIKIFIVD